MSAPVTATGERVARLLALVPWLQRHQDAPVEEVAAAFGISVGQLVADFELVFLCGLPGYGPAELIEVHWESGRVRIEQAADLDRPLRLTRGEALALVVALRQLAATPGRTDAGAVERALAKVEAAAGDGTVPDAVVVAPGEDDAHLEEVARRVSTALAEGRALHLRYASASRDEETERTVDPLRRLDVGVHPYLEAWCRRASGVRLFRLDRVLSAEVTDAPSSPPPGLRPRVVDDALYVPGPDDERVVLALAPDGRWVAEYHPCEVLSDSPSELRVALFVGERSWLLRLLAGLGPAASVVGPAGLREDLRAFGRAALARYDAPA